MQDSISEQKGGDLSAKRTHEELMEFFEKNQNAHVTAKINDDFYKTSKVQIPTERPYNTRKYPKLILKAFEELKKEFTYESQKQEVILDYTKVDGDWSTDGFQSFTVSFEKEENPTAQYESIDVNQRHLQKIADALPIGFKLWNVSTTIYRYEEDHAKKPYWGGCPKPKMAMRIVFHKEQRKSK